MPILNIDVVGEESDFPNDLAQRIADQAGRVLESRPQGTWVKIRFTSVDQYAENQGAAAGGQPIFISLILAEVAEAAVLRGVVRELAQVVADAAARPTDRVHIVVEPDAIGRIAFGGQLLE